MGPIAIFPDAVFQWNIQSSTNLTPDNFVLFEMVHPKPEIVIFGYGCPQHQLETQFVSIFHVTILKKLHYFTKSEHFDINTIL